MGSPARDRRGLMIRLRRPLLNALYFIAGAIALGMLQGLLDPANETDARIRAEAAARAEIAKQELPPEAYLEHPLGGSTWIEQSGPDKKGEIERVRRYTPAADLAGTAAR